MAKDPANYCPICNKDNECGNLKGYPQGACWCSKERFPQEIFERVPVDLLGKSCICKACLDKFMKSL